MTEKERRYKEIEKASLEKARKIIIKDGYFNTILPYNFNYLLGYIDQRYIGRNYIPDNIEIVNKR